MSSSSCLPGRLSADPYVAPPGIPKERLTILREAFMRTMADPDFLADAKKLELEISPVSGPAVEQLLNEVYATPTGRGPEVERASQVTCSGSTHRVPC